MVGKLKLEKDRVQLFSDSPVLQIMDPQAQRRDSIPFSLAEKGCVKDQKQPVSRAKRVIVMLVLWVLLVSLTWPVTQLYIIRYKNPHFQQNQQTCGFQMVSLGCSRLRLRQAKAVNYFDVKAALHYFKGRSRCTYQPVIKHQPVPYSTLPSQSTCMRFPVLICINTAMLTDC